MKVPVYWLTNHEGIDARGPWDTGILEELFQRRLGPIPANITFEHRDVVEPGPCGIVILPARHHTSPEDVAWLNGEIAKLDGVLLILCGDEEASFPWKEVRHGRIRFWVQMPDPDHYADLANTAFFFGNGWRKEWPDAVDRSWRKGVTRSVKWAFAGQVTNNRRKQCANGLRKTRPAGVLVETPGFAQGLPLDEYADLMSSTWVAPCPGGPRSVDTFRLYEALEAGAIPILDLSDGGDRYWDFVYPDWEDYLIGSADLETIGGDIEMIHANLYHYAAKAASWWQQQKRAMVQRLRKDLTIINPGIGEFYTDDCVAIVTTSPVPSNPDLSMIAETLGSIPPLVDVYVACDGVRPEQAHMTAAYEQFIYELARDLQHRYTGAVVLYDGDWRHQARTTNQVLLRSDLFDTRTILFMEHDTPLVTDEPLQFDECVSLVANGHLDVIRFHHEGRIPHEHEYLMVDHQTKSMLGVPVRRTRQWSQRPHVANANYYWEIMHRHFSPVSRTMIEDRMHSVCQSESYDQNRLAIYHPDGNIKRSYHLDGRGDEPKFDMRF